MDNLQEERKQQARIRENLAKIDKKLIVISGKGGVGKTTVAVNLAYELANNGKKTGILDVDIHGPNVAKMLGIEGEKLPKNDLGMGPVEVSPNLKAVSMALLLESPDTPIIWRGPLKMVTIRQFLSDINWGELDYLIIDSPPGTGDEPLSVCQLIPDIDGAIIVTTPQDVAILDSRKSIQFIKQLKIPVLGIIENMSGFICPYCKKRIDLFGYGGGEKTANELNITFLGRISIEPEIVKAGDLGQPLLNPKKAALPENAINEIKEIIKKVENILKTDDKRKL